MNKAILAAACVFLVLFAGCAGPKAGDVISTRLTGQKNVPVLAGGLSVTYTGTEPGSVSSKYTVCGLFEFSNTGARVERVEATRFKLEDSEGFSHDPTINARGDKLGITNLDSGQKAKGSVCFEIPLNSTASKITYYYYPPTGGNGTAVTWQAN